MAKPKTKQIGHLGVLWSPLDASSPGPMEEMQTKELLEDVRLIVQRLRSSPASWSNL